MIFFRFKQVLAVSFVSLFLFFAGVSLSWASPSDGHSLSDFICTKNDSGEWCIRRSLVRDVESGLSSASSAAAAASGEEIERAFLLSAGEIDIDRSGDSFTPGASELSDALSEMRSHLNRSHSVLAALFAKNLERQIREKLESGVAGAAEVSQSEIEAMLRGELNLAGQKIMAWGKSGGVFVILGCGFMAWNAGTMWSASVLNPYIYASVAMIAMGVSLNFLNPYIQPLTADLGRWSFHSANTPVQAPRPQPEFFSRMRTRFLAQFHQTQGQLPWTEVEARNTWYRAQNFLTERYNALQLDCATSDLGREARIRRMALDWLSVTFLYPDLDWDHPLFRSLVRERTRCVMSGDSGSPAELKESLFDAIQALVLEWGYPWGEVEKAFFQQRIEKWLS